MVRTFVAAISGFSFYQLRTGWPRQLGSVAVSDDERHVGWQLALVINRLWDEGMYMAPGCSPGMIAKSYWRTVAYYPNHCPPVVLKTTRDVLPIGFSPGQ